MDMQPLVSFFKPTEEEMRRITDLACWMRETLTSGGFSEEVAVMMVQTWWDSVMTSSVEVE